MNKENTAVGFWVSYILPEKITTLLEGYFAAACMYDVNFFAFSPKDVNLKNNTINGCFWENGRFIKKITAMPKLFDLRLGGNLDRRYPDIYKALKNSGYQVSRRTIGNKNDNTKWLIKNKKFADYVIESQNYENCCIKEFLSEHKIVILKPSTGRNGDGIYKIRLINDDRITVHYLSDEKEDSLSNFIVQNHDMFTQRKYMVQTFVNSTTINGSPMDIRLNVARGHKGKWEISLMYFRVNIGNYIGTNMGEDQRLHSTVVLKSLEYQLGKNEGRRVYKELMLFAEEFPEHFQKKLKFITPELCMDIGIDRNNGNKLKIFEVGISPGTSFTNIPALPLLNMQFYKYLTDEHLSDVTKL